MALRSCTRLWIDINGVVWTGLHARFASNAHVRIELDDTIVSLVHGRYRANPDAGWIRAVITASDLKITSDIGVLTRFYTLNPCALNAQRNFIFTFTRG